MAITLKWLKNHTVSTSLSRGYAYRNDVSKLYKFGNRYTAKVRGSEMYEVEIHDKGDDITAECTCPYDYEGYCKHIVAVALEIIEGSFVEKEVSVLEKNINLQNIDIKINTDDFYNKVFLKAPQRKQKEFLFSLFSQNEEVCKQFHLFMYPPPPPLSNTINISELSNEIAAIVNNIDIEDYQTDDDDDYDEYDDEYSDYDRDSLEETLKENLNVYETRITQQSEKGNWLDSAKIMLAVYEAAYLVESHTSEYLEDTWVTDMVLGIFETMVENWTAEAENNIPKEAVGKVLSLIFERRSVFARFSHKPNTPYVRLTDGLASLMEYCLSEGV